MAISDKKLGEQLSIKNDLRETGYDSDGFVRLSTFSSSAQSNPKFVKQTANSACDTTFLKEGNNTLNQTSSKSNSSQISLKNLYGLRNKLWSGMIPDEKNMPAGPGEKFTGKHISSSVIHPGVDMLNVFLVGAGGGGGGWDSQDNGGSGGSGCIVNTNVDLSGFGSLDKKRRIFVVAGGGGYAGVAGTNLCGLSGSGLPMIDYDPGTGWGEMSTCAISFPYNNQSDRQILMNGWTHPGRVEFNIILYFNSQQAKISKYYLKGRADDRAWIFDVTDTDASAVAGANPIIALGNNADNVNTLMPWYVPNNGQNAEYNIRVLRVQLANDNMNSGTGFSLKLLDESGNEVWNTRKRDGMGFLNFPHQGGRGGTSGRRGVSGGGGAGGGASFVAIESPIDSGLLSIVAIAGGGGGGAGYGNLGTNITTNSKSAQSVFLYDTNLQNNALYSTQDSAFVSCSPYGQYEDPYCVVRYTNRDIVIKPAGEGGDYDYGGAGGGGGGGGQSGKLYIYRDHLGNDTTYYGTAGVSSTGGCNGISGTFSQSTINDCITMPGVKVNPAYFPSVVDVHTGVNLFNIGTKNQTLMYDNTKLLWTGSTVAELYANVPGLGGQGNKDSAYKNGNNGFAYVEWDASFNYKSPSNSWKIMPNTNNGIISSERANYTGSLESIVELFSPSFDTSNSSQFGFTVRYLSGDNISVSKVSGKNNTFKLSASSTTYPKTMTGVIQVDATHNGETKTFYYGYYFSWRLQFDGNVGAVYVTGTAWTAPETQGGA